MKLRIACVTIALALVPTLSIAAGCNYSKQAMSCAAGTTYDAETGTCVADPTT